MDKYEYTNKIFDEYEKRFMEAVMKKPRYRTWETSDREKIKEHIKEVLGYKDELIPQIKITDKKTVKIDTYQNQVIVAQSWENCYTCANLYRPLKEGKVPIIFVLCGHGENGRLNKAYQAMAQRLAKQGAAVLLIENMGQGERSFMGHVPCSMPFYCGLSLQGMIVMETVAWIRAASKWDFADETKIGICGNSGGGLLSMFVGALCEEVSCIASTGYPSSFAWIGAKEKLHCHCNMLPHILSKLEMHDVYSLIAPRPLLLMQGYNDEYFPSDLFNKNARNVLFTYKKFGKDENFIFKVVDGLHSWDANRRFLIAQFFADRFSLENALEGDDTNDLLNPAEAYAVIPENALTTDEVAMSITGVKTDKELKLWDIFVPTYKGKMIDEKEIIKEFGNGNCMQIFAQFECFL